jgi:hypothetical protein
MHVLSLSTIWEKVAMPLSLGCTNYPKTFHPGSARIGLSLMGEYDQVIDAKGERRGEGNERGFLGV